MGGRPRIDGQFKMNHRGTVIARLAGQGKLAGVGLGEFHVRDVVRTGKKM